MNVVKVQGKIKQHKVFLYTLSTCGWCKLTKKYLKEHDVDHEYVDVDLADWKEREAAQDDILARGGDLSFPCIIVDDKTLINGFNEKAIAEKLGL